VCLLVSYCYMRIPASPSSSCVRVHLTSSTPVVPVRPTRTQTRQTHTLPIRTLHAHSKHTSSASTGSPRPSPRSPAVPHPIRINILAGQREGKRTRRKTAREFRLIASSKGGAGIGLGSESGIVSGVDAESETLSSSSLGRRTTLRPETGEYVLLESGVGKKARSRSK
jgi:hypothetical protein